MAGWEVTQQALLRLVGPDPAPLDDAHEEDTARQWSLTVPPVRYSRAELDHMAEYGCRPGGRLCSPWTRRVAVRALQIRDRRAAISSWIGKL